jgi:uncharacterized membrane protein HdeD (DUF308 family)
VIAIVLGLIAFLWPGITVGALVLLFGAYALLDGVMSIIGAVRASRSHERWGVLVFEGLTGVAAAAVTVLIPAVTALVLIYVIAVWALVTGVFEITAAVRLRQHSAGEWLLALGGIASIIFGILVMVFPLAGALVIALWIGAYAIVFGVVLISLGIRLRNWVKSVPCGASHPLPSH